MTTMDVFNYNVPAESDFGYSQAIKSGELIHVSGQLSFGEAGEFLHAGDFAAQLEQTYANMDRVLDHYGCTRNQVVSQTLYVVNLRQNAAATAEGNLGYFGGHRPASTVLGVPELTLPGQVIEISFVIDTKLPA
ncbi:putative translation initiation inhibitor [Streptomyces ambofaciens ATCC 23877]|uniref:Putative translation initiation inhibitor n=2 Tax=Streptomyces ambofaciens (strain ATCC 23877 / 3486 / DSM 40053 / JCM 4204 / NBRC 12836 / NRRL B-2516) TaxID=278992 RepID=Q1RQP5_STRA7|nr:RidA family protein [Streptomyces ambofaciens]AKZ53274.1 putative translation initiation inhibitor [Streptomyces ambofaciens ATCC 23877]CAI78120.1 putative translation initiation inhibitor [Streptomyces ambofaciens ATCC 23877]CAI78394.1 putative translation initiation inhibitor [Streptomyces ambofaciens ATCC 23877]CAJ87899.1 putative translation initiation inhibitor [Streptomyces ambofaciens ATCC 23877]CAJ89177.1 putative translation initiation inhibitor [Streptomyces ambofaciens ATCC 23877